jgi:16S rRNA U516 pseudouridylate synthase RsuA-like enzyme
MDQQKYPIRINKYLAMHNYATRTGADELIKKGLVTINNRKAVLGDKVEKGDKVIVDSKRNCKIKSWRGIVPCIYYETGFPAVRGTTKSQR